MHTDLASGEVAVIASWQSVTSTCAYGRVTGGVLVFVSRRSFLTPPSSPAPPSFRSGVLTGPPHCDDDLADVSFTAPAGAPALPPDDGEPARSPASNAKLGRVHPRLVAAAHAAGIRQLRFSQARHMAAAQGGGDGVHIAATGSGRGVGSGLW